jgi:hypothetical protein
MHNYRAYVLGMETRRYQKVAQFPGDHADDHAAMKAAEKLVGGHDVELWESARLVAKFDHRSGSVTIGDQLPMALRTVPSESLVPTVEIESGEPDQAYSLAATS